MATVVTGAAVAGLVLGFVGGLLAAKLKLWCERCGVTKECPSHGPTVMSRRPRDAPLRASSRNAVTENRTGNMQKPAQS